ncbi:MAG: hypothetical protein WBD38_12930, partial [Candidatus Dormiibacterota bacterium]
VAQFTTRIGGLVMLILGLSFWTGHLASLVPLHRILGFVLVIALWTLATIAFRAGAPLGQVILAFAWGFVAPALGLTQDAILVGGLHWIAQIIHLVVGLLLIGQAEGLARAIRSQPPQRAGNLPAQAV